MVRVRVRVRVEPEKKSGVHRSAASGGGSSLQYACLLPAAASRACAAARACSQRSCATTIVSSRCAGWVKSLEVGNRPLAAGMRLAGGSLAGRNLPSQTTLAVRPECYFITDMRRTTDLADAVTGLLAGNSLEETGISRNHSAYTREGLSPRSSALTRERRPSIDS